MDSCRKKAYLKSLDEINRDVRLQEGMIEEGELKKAEEIAIKLLKKGTDISEIADIAELSLDEIKELQRDLKK